MDLSFWLKGLLLGFSIAAPVGPIGVLCIRRTLADGRLNGLVSGLGAATADAFYGWTAAFGLAFLTNFLVNQQSWIRLLGGAFLLYLGVRTFLSPPADRAAVARPGAQGLLGAYTSTFLLTLSNPATILSFVAIFAGLGVASAARGSYGAAGLLVLGVFCGSTLWWFLLSGLVSLFRARLAEGKALLWVNRLSGLVILAFGVAAIVSIVF
ncbi:MAG TPA: LysE family transporter [Anaerolineaceae bacterium]|nr:LysE family transporter [Anaerolineaceae bacterium]